MVSKEKYVHFIKEMLKEETVKDEERLKKRKENKSGEVGVFIAIFLVVVLPAFIINFVVGIVGFFVWLLIIAFAKPGGKSYSYYKNEYRNRALDFLLKGMNYTFNQESDLSEDIVINSQLIGEFDEFECKDRLSINIPNDDNSNSNCYLNLCDLEVTREEERDIDSSFDEDSPFHSSTTKTVTIDVYKGMFGYVEFPFEFRCLLCLNSEYKKKGVILRNVKLEDIVFAKKFRVWCDDQIEARYILTPDTMEKLLYLKSRLKGLRITLVDNKMYIASRGINLFELSGKKENTETLFERIYDDVSVILWLVNEIKNNNKVFRM